MKVTSRGIIDGVIQPQYGGRGTQFNENNIPTYSRRLLTTLYARPAIPALDEVSCCLALIVLDLKTGNVRGQPVYPGKATCHRVGVLIILEALRIMQHIGIDYLKTNGMEHILEEKGVVPD